MKNKFLWMATLALVLNLFSACSDDDEREMWKELPTTPIKIDGSNATMTVNGETSSTGEVAFKAESESRAMLTLTDVVGGYPSLEIPVEMTPQAGGNSYAFTGSTTVNTAPQVRSVSADPALLTVDASGTISVDGKLSLVLTAYGPGLNLGTYTGATLTLTYSGASMMGATVYYSVSGTTPVLTLANIVPGEPEVSLEGVYTNGNGAFSGTATTSGSATVNYEGAVNAANGMTLALNVTMPDALGLVGTYGWADITNETEDDAWEDQEMRDEYGFGEKFPTTSACYLRIEDTDDWTHGFAYLFRPLLGVILPQALENVTFSADGNILANYSNDAIQVLQPEDPSMFMEYYMYGTVTQSMLDGYLAGRTYKESPKNLAFWFEKDGKLMVKLNVSAIVTQALSDKGMEGADGLGTIIEQILNSSASEIKALLSSDAIAGLLGSNSALLTSVLNNISDADLEVLLGYVRNGFPLNVKQENGHTHVYIGQEFMDVVVKAFSTPEVMTALETALPADFQQAIILIEAFLSSYADMTEFEIGLDLQK